MLNVGNGLSNCASEFPSALSKNQLLNVTLDIILIDVKV